MKKKRYLPSLCMIIGFLLLILSAIALPSAGESSRTIVVGVAVGGVALILGGIVAGARKKRNKK